MRPVLRGVHAPFPRSGIRFGVYAGSGVPPPTPPDPPADGGGRIGGNRGSRPTEPVLKDGPNTSTRERPLKRPQLGSRTRRLFHRPAGVASCALTRGRSIFPGRPSAGRIRWQGTTSGTGLTAMQRPTARRRHAESRPWPQAHRMSWSGRSRPADRREGPDAGTASSHAGRCEGRGNRPPGCGRRIAGDEPARGWARVKGTVPFSLKRKLGQSPSPRRSSGRGPPRPPCTAMAEGEPHDRTVAAKHGHPAQRTGEDRHGRT